MPENPTKKELQREYVERVKTGGVYIVRNTQNGRYLLECAVDIKSAANRFEFTKATGSALSMKLSADFKEFGKDVFTFEVLESIEKNPDQNDREFTDDIKLLLELWQEKFDSTLRY